MTYKNIMGALPNPLLEEFEQFEIMQWITAGVNLLPEIDTTEQIKYLEIIDGKVKLPTNFKKVYGVFKVDREPTQEECTDLGLEAPVTEYPEDSKIEIYVKILLDTPYFQEAYIPLKYVGDLSFLCTGCPNINSCSEEFTIRDNYLYTSFESGAICLHYAGLQCNSEGDIILPDSQVLSEYLQKYVLKKAYEVKMYSKEENSLNLYQLYRTEADILFRRARGEMFAHRTNADSVRTAAFGSYLNLLARYNNVTFR